MMLSRGLTALALAVATSVVAVPIGTVAAATASPPETDVVVLPEPVELRVGPDRGPSRVAPPDTAGRLGSMSTSPAWTINYDTAFLAPEAAPARAAFEYAVDIWRSQVQFSVPVVVDARWRDDLGPGVLGSAGPTYLYPISTAEGLRYYPAALDNQILGMDRKPSLADITADFSSIFTNWYFGTDGQPGTGALDFVSVVLHELGHGLGFVGSPRDDGLTLRYGLDRSSTADVVEDDPIIFDNWVVNGAGAKVIRNDAYPNGSTALAEQLQSDNLFWHSSRTSAVAGGGRPKMYAPSIWQGGSSFSHLDEATYGPGSPDSLMTPQIGPAEAVHRPGLIALAIMQDLGFSPSVDDDADGAVDTDDNCVGLANPDQANLDGDRMGDVCDDIADVSETSFAYPYVKALIAKGVTAGCSGPGEPVRYCPAGDVTRRQMAIFLLRAVDITQDGSNLAAYEGMFGDVPDSYSARFIEELSRRAVTGGCTAAAPDVKANYCPEPVAAAGNDLGLVTRQQMALFLLRTAEISEDGSNLPDYAGIFADVPDSYAARFIEELYRRGVTGGCNAASGDTKANYCPSGKVSREAMAIFLVRTFGIPLPS